MAKDREKDSDEEKPRQLKRAFDPSVEDHEEEVGYFPEPSQQRQEALIDEIDQYERKLTMDSRKSMDGRSSIPKALTKNIFSSEKKRETGSAFKRQSPFSNKSPHSDTSMLR